MSRPNQIGLRTALILLLAWNSQAAWSQQPSAPPATEQTKPGDKVVITVDDQKMTAADVDKFIESLPPQYRAFYSGLGKSQLPRYLVQMKVLLEGARKDNLKDDPKVKRAIEIASNSILADAERQRLQDKIPVSEKEIEDLYQSRKEDFDEVHLRHIVVITDDASIQLPERPTHPPLSEADARKKLEDLRKQALAGTDFALLAKANSDDISTARTGGDLGYAKRSGLLPPVAKAAFALKPGEVSDIIGTPYGLEIIKVEGRRTQSLAEVREQLKADIQKSKAGKAFQQTLSQHKVVVDQDFFSGSPNANATASAVSH
jgi:peptidyl-prolyl cis-trans isomerase C